MGLQFYNMLMTLLFENARHMKLLLYLYEMMAGLKLNFYKSEILVNNVR